MQLTFERIGVVAGALLSIGAVAAGLGYGWPWFSSAEGRDLKVAEASHYMQVQQSVNAINRSLDDAHVNQLLTQKSFLLMQKEMELKVHDRLSAAQTQARIDWIDLQLAHPNAPPPPPPS